MIYKILADFVVVIHFLWIVFLFLGAIWGRRYLTIKIFHLSGLAFAIFIQVFNLYCPLTHIEVWLRSKHDPQLAYSGSFIIYYIDKLIYIEVQRYIIFIVTIILCALNILLYFPLLCHSKQGKKF